MSPVPEADCIDSVRAALIPFARKGARDGQYLWETVSVDRVRWDDAASVRFAGDAKCLLVLDPNQWNMPARLHVARLAHRDDAPVGYLCEMHELSHVFSRSWTADADFYILSGDRRLLAMRTHEDVGSQAGAWVPRNGEANQPAPAQRP